MLTCDDSNNKKNINASYMYIHKCKYIYYINICMHILYEESDNANSLYIYTYTHMNVYICSIYI